MLIKACLELRQYHSASYGSQGHICSDELDDPFKRCHLWPASRRRIVPTQTCPTVLTMPDMLGIRIFEMVSMPEHRPQSGTTPFRFHISKL